MTGRAALQPEIGIAEPSADPSRWGRRLPVAVLALVGCAVSSYLALFELHVIGGVWDPLFGDGSEKVLTSALSQALPVPDAVLGAFMYALEACLELSGGPARWRVQPWWVFVTGLTAAALAATGVVLVASQPLLTGTFCTLCICSAVISWSIAATVFPEVKAAVLAYRTPSAQRKGKL